MLSAVDAHQTFVFHSIFTREKAREKEMGREEQKLIHMVFTKCSCHLSNNVYQFHLSQKAQFNLHETETSPKQVATTQASKPDAEK